jgi:hypothetical protein
MALYVYLWSIYRFVYIWRFSELSPRESVHSNRDTAQTLLRSQAQGQRCS